MITNDKYCFSIIKEVSKILPRWRNIGLDAYLLALYFVITPIHQALLTTHGGTVNKYLAFVVILAILVLQYNKKTNSFSWNKRMISLLSLLSFWYVCSLLWSYSRIHSILGIYSAISYFFFTITVCSRKWNNDEKELFMTTYIIACVYYSIMLFQMSSIAKRATFVLDDGRHSDQNLLSANIALGCLFALYCLTTQSSKIMKYVFGIFIFTIVMGIISTGSRGGLIALFVGAIYVHMHQQKKKILLLTSALVAIILMTYIKDYIFNNNTYLISRFNTESLFNATSRTSIWAEYIKMLIYRPWGIFIGYGYGSTAMAYSDFYGTNWPPATHNDYIAVICRSGIIGLIGLFHFCKYIWNRCISLNDKLGCSCMITMLVASMSVNMLGTYGWWNAMIFAYIGVGTIYNKTT